MSRARVPTDAERERKEQMSQDIPPTEHPIPEEIHLPVTDSPTATAATYLPTWVVKRPSIYGF